MANSGFMKDMPALHAWRVDGAREDPCERHHAVVADFAAGRLVSGHWTGVIDAIQV